MEKSKELIAVEKLPLTEIMTIAKSFAESGMFTDIKSAAQAVVKILAGQEIGIPPFAAMSGIHIIQGKPAIGAGLMAASVKGSGKYNYKVTEQTEKICSIDFYQGKELIGNSTFTEADAKKAGTKNMDKYPKNMLFARAISNGIKWFTPDVFSGPVYTPEELGNPEITEDVPHQEVRILTQQVLDKVTKDNEAIRKELYPVQTRPAISEKQFTQLSKRIADSESQEAAMELLNKAQASFTVSDKQAAELVGSISILPIPA